MLINTLPTDGIQSNPPHLISSNYSETDGSITFEPIPADYSILTLHTLPPTGGDTLWASGYEVYDRLSPPWQRFVDGLTATYNQPGFLKSANDHGFKLHSEPRGAPENVGGILEAVHPVPFPLLTTGSEAHADRGFRLCAPILLLAGSRCLRWVTMWVTSTMCPRSKAISY